MCISTTNCTIQAIASATTGITSQVADYYVTCTSDDSFIRPLKQGYVFALIAKGGLSDISNAQWANDCPTQVGAKQQVCVH
jgi:hypothetical protein